MAREAGTGFSVAFDSELYLTEQITAFQEKIDALPNAQVIIEFGGKPFGDYHASRVLPGYDPDSKAAVLSNLVTEVDASIVLVVNARDILQAPYGRTPRGRIRGDSGLRYDHETVRLIEEAVNGKGIPVEGVVLAVTPRNYNDTSAAKINDFATSLKDAAGLRLKSHYAIDGYPNIENIDREGQAFSRNERLTVDGRPLVLVSPGGGSGKFGVALSEAFHALQEGKQVNFIKFETFPVFTLSPNHALNMAFQAATADLDNDVIIGSDGRTTYDKDDQNYRLLRRVGELFEGHGDSLAHITSPFDFSVNVIERAIMDEAAIGIASLREIHRRLRRYTTEYRNGDERLGTIENAARCLGRAVAGQLTANLGYGRDFGRIETYENT